MRIRFVGGQLHNKLIECGDHPCPTYAVAVRNGENQERYELKRFRTAYKTSYVQYIHESLLDKNGKPEPCTYKERFKKWKLSLGVR
jgi:hypothetical protein